MRAPEIAVEKAVAAPAEGGTIRVAGPAARPRRFRWARRLAHNRNVVLGSTIFLILLLAAVAAPLISTHNPTRLNPADRLRPPSSGHYLGTDEFGRDVYSLVIYGARVSLLVGGVTMLITSVGGVVIGLVAGYYRRLDLVVMRVMDGLMAFPAILLAIAFMAARGPGVWNVILALSACSLPATALPPRSPGLGPRHPP